MKAQTCTCKGYPVCAHGPKAAGVRLVLEALQCSLPKHRQYAEPWERHMRAVDITRGLLLDCCTCPRTALDAQGEPNESTCELTEEEHAVFVPGRTVVHYIIRRSGNREDENPLCGADSFHRTESGIMHDSAGNSMNICKECAEIALRTASVYVPGTTAQALCVRLRACGASGQSPAEAVREAAFLFGNMRSKHKTIKHSAGVYVDGDIHTNTVESAFSLLKRGISGSWHKVSAKHLSRYLAEMEFRFNRRKNRDLFTETLRHMVNTDPLSFAELIK